MTISGFDQMTLGFDDRDGFIWLNGSCVPWREARVHVLNHGLHYGSCVFDGERAYEGRIFAQETTRNAYCTRQSFSICAFPSLRSSGRQIADPRTRGAGRSTFAPLPGGKRDDGAFAQVSASTSQWPLGLASMFDLQTKMVGIHLTSPVPAAGPTPAPVHKGGGLYVASTLPNTLLSARAVPMPDARLGGLGG
jgi:branched-chain amino acid aminotransferase